MPALYDKLLHNIYALVDEDRELPGLLAIMDEFFSSPESDEQYGDHTACITSLLPHVNRANALLEKMSALRLTRKHTDAVLDHIPMGIVLISPVAGIISKNSRAAALLDHIGARHDDGMIQFSQTGQQKSFLDTVKRVAGGKTQGSPLRMGELNLWISHFGDGREVQLAVYLGHHTFCRNIRMDQLMSYFGLTDKEAQLTARLCDGHASLEDAAEELGISIATARSHLKRIFSKTGAERQADLVKMVLINPILTLQQNAPPQCSPSKESNVIRLPSGRILSYAEFGNPNGEPLLFCHALTGGRLMLPVDAAGGVKTRFRLIAPDRAGYGFSSQAQGDPMQQWLEDMRQFLPQLGIRQCCVAGHSAGGAYAMALAVDLPDIVNHLCLISSVAPLRNLDDAAHLLPVNRMVLHLARSNPEAARAFIRLSMLAALREPDSYLKLITNSSPDMNREVADNAALKQHLLDAFRETTRQGIAHLIDELMYISTRWRLNPARIPCPVSIWHGTQDKHSPFPLMLHFQSRVKQLEQTRWIKDSGHYILFHHWSAIEKQLCTKK